MKTKLCRRCFKEKAEKDFYERPLNRDGLSSYCRVCTRKTTLDWRKRNPHKRAAHQAVATALRTGDIVKPQKCEKCHKKVYLLAHHPNYKKPLQVIWLCDACHVKLHIDNGDHIVWGKNKKCKYTNHADIVGALNVALKGTRTSGRDNPVSALYRKEKI